MRQERTGLERRRMRRLRRSWAHRPGRTLDRGCELVSSDADDSEQEEQTIYMCPSCGTKMLHDSVKGKPVECPWCGAEMVISDKQA
jgi:DNA-directed RNA polymerase subunit RPC12/RpoP